MAKIKINKLPKGFKLVDNKVVEDNLMRDGGDLRTGDQADYGLVTTPQNYYGETNFNNSRDENVRFSLSSVPRDNANIEAEGGETVLTDLNDDGSFGLYDITGPRHSKGGVPMFLPEQSFIFSDTPKLKFGKEEMSEFDVGGDKKTPATLSKRFQLNEFYGELDSQYADNISSLSAELMLKKNMNDLSKLAFMQEAKKDFEDGVPLASHPYLLTVGVDPLEFTAQVEQISKEKARQRAIDALSPEQQEQLMMLQSMIASAQQAPQDGQNNAPELVEEMPMPGQPGPSQSTPFDEMELADANNDMMATAQFGSELSNFMRKAQEGNGEETESNSDNGFINPYPKDSDNYKKLQQYKDNGYEITVVDGKIRIFKPFQSRFENTEKRERIAATDVSGSGDTPIYSTDIEDQGQVLEGSPIGQYQYGRLSGGNRPLNQTESSAGSYGSADIMTSESAEDFEMRWGDVTAQIEDWDYNAGANHPQWAQFQKLAEKTRKEEAEAIGIPYVPYFKEKNSDGYIKGEGFDGALGLHTYNTPRLNVDITSQEEMFMDLPEKEEEIIIPPIEEKPRSPKEWWAQDINNVTAMNSIEDKLLLPWAPTLEDQKIDYVLDDWTGAVNANTASQNVMAQALGAYGPQAIARSNIQGKTLDANAKVINKVNQNNVKTMNQVASLQPQLDLTVDRLNAAKDTKLYDDTNVTLQNAQNFSNWKTAKTNELYNQGITNASNTYNLNELYDHYNINPRSGGDLQWEENGKDLYKTNNEDLMQKYYDAVVAHEKNTGNQMSAPMMESIFPNLYMGPETTVGKRELKQTGLEGAGYQGSGNILDEEEGSQGGEKIKKWAMPFYSGKMGV